MIPDQLSKLLIMMNGKIKEVRTSYVYVILAVSSDHFGQNIVASVTDALLNLIITVHTSTTVLD